MKFNKKEIKKLLKHKEPFIFVDTAEILSNSQINGTFEVLERNHDFFKGHFPGEPIMPGIFLQEFMGQLSGILTFKKYLDQGYRSIADFDCDIYLLRVKDFVYKGRVKPNCVLKVESKVETMPMDYFYKVTGKVLVNSHIKAKGTLIIYFKVHKIKK